MPRLIVTYAAYVVKQHARVTVLATECRYEKPTAIQAQALPAALSGRDVLVSTLMTLCPNLKASCLVTKGLFTKTCSHAFAHCCIVRELHAIYVLGK